MSMIRDLRAAVRPSVPAQSRTRTARTTPPATPRAPSAVVDCAVYRDGQRVRRDRR